VTAHQSRWRPTLRASLFALAVACTLPIVLVSAGLVYHFTVREFARSERALADRTALLLNAVEQRVQNITEDLQILAESPALKAGDFVTFRTHMIEANRIFGGYGTVLVDRTGQLLISTRRAPGEALPRRTNLETQNRVFETGKPQVSGLIGSVATQDLIASVEVPVRIGSEVQYALATGLRPEILADVMDKLVPQGWIGSIADNTGRLIARVPDIGVVGQTIIPTLLRQVGQPGGKWIETQSREGVAQYTSFVRSEALGWTAFMSLPRELVVGDIRTDAAVLGGFVILALMASLLLARQFSLWILHSLQALEKDVAELGQRGTVTLAEPTGLEEVYRMRGVLERVGGNILSATRRVEHERTLLRSTVEAMPIGVVILAPDGTVLLVNQQAMDFWANDKLEEFADFKNVKRLKLDGTPYPVTDWPLARALRTGEITHNEEVLHRRSNGTDIRICINAAPVRDREYNIVAAVATFHDVTELRDALRQQSILIDEVNHRVKNTMATVQSMALLTRSGASSIDDYVTRFEKRLLALSRAYNLMTANNWQGADLRDIVATTVAPYNTGNQVTVQGPSIKLPSNHTLALAAALQELVTNAAKYGSLSTPAGKLHIRWETKGDRLVLDWQESSGPAVSPPTRRGFGTKLIQEVLTRETDWTANMEYLPAGLSCRLSIALR